MYVCACAHTLAEAGIVWHRHCVAQPLQKVFHRQSMLPDSNNVRKDTHFEHELHSMQHMKVPASSQHKGKLGDAASSSFQHTCSILYVGLLKKVYTVNGPKCVLVYQNIRGIHTAILLVSKSIGCRTVGQQACPAAGAALPTQAVLPHSNMCRGWTKSGYSRSVWCAGGLD